ncbi:MAG: tetraacyldisaccharide 4'-kinase [Bacteroidetes bacterium]|nr:MAG: tetraacyldisaccharide 4'-kinase [Bacteroidota bacterium]
MKLLRKILVPVVPVYQGVTWIRNYCYDNNILKSRHYDFPVICVGNLSVGGTGKTPMIEYLIRLLKNEYLVGTLSRGYGRQSKGFMIADEQSTALTIGDEPFQFHQKFPKIIVSVGEDRQNAIRNLLLLKKSPEVLLLDDAFQHRKVKAGFNILLTCYNDLYINDMLLPTGNLREPKSGAKRADVIIVTKCPLTISKEEQAKIRSQLNVEANQQLFFSTILYSNSIFSKEKVMALNDLKSEKFTLVTGIANPESLINFLNAKGFDFNHEAFKDHHDFTSSEISDLRNKGLIITTEKDYMRLKDKLESDKLFHLPIESKILNAEAFDNSIKSFVINF